MRPEKTMPRLADLPEMPGTIDTMAWNRTGTWRFLVPTPARWTPPCQAQCPAGIPIPEFINALKTGKMTEALEVIMGYNPLPRLTGRLCYHPCQTTCIRRELDQHIFIQTLERHAAEAVLAHKPVINESGQGAVGVIGAGPFGLSCAYFLRLKGIRVALIEVNERPGGDLLKINPEKLNPRLVDQDISRLIQITDLDVRLGQNIAINDLPAMSDNYQVLMLDPTAAHLSEIKPGFPAAFDPVNQARIEEKAFKIELPERLLPFKPALIAHYIGLAGLTAQRIYAMLTESLTISSSPVAGAGRLGRERVRLDLFQKVAPIETMESVRGMDWNADQIRAAAERCLSCGVCNQCGQCQIFCPDQSIRINGTSVEVDLYHCKGCGICANECPRGVITMEHDHQ
jgi:Pyruvate/2-oxoacid:ferredoxin oxidoreductase delta subunit